MSQQTISDVPFRWVDVINPTPAELQTLAAEFGLHATSVRDCLQPEHLPKAERIGEHIFMIVRAIDEVAAPQAITIRALTRKVAIFCGHDWVITVQRVEQPYFKRLKERALNGAFAQIRPTEFCLLLLNEALLSFDTPLSQFSEQMEKLEGRVFKGRGRKQILGDAHSLRRRSGTYRRLLHYSLGMVKYLPTALKLPVSEAGPYYQELRENTERLSFQADQSYENLQHLVNLHVSLESYRTNEVMRLLTVFSLLFLPLNLIAGIYGMNFQHMPELAWPHGYAFALALMASVAVGVIWWFRRKGWLS